MLDRKVIGVGSPLVHAKRRPVVDHKTSRIDENSSRSQPDGRCKLKIIKSQSVAVMKNGSARRNHGTINSTQNPTTKRQSERGEVCGEGAVKRRRLIPTEVTGSTPRSRERRKWP